MTDTADGKKWEKWAGRALSGHSLHEPGRGVLQRATELAARWKPSERKWLAWLIFDSASQPLPAGVRSGPPAERRVLFGLGPGPDEGGELQLDVRLRRCPGSDNRTEVTGQLLPPRADAAVSIRVGKRVRRQPLDRSCSFVIGSLPAGGSARLTVHLGDDDPVELPPIALGG